MPRTVHSQDLKAHKKNIKINNIIKRTRCEIEVGKNGSWNRTKLLFAVLFDRSSVRRDQLALDPVLAVVPGTDIVAHTMSKLQSEVWLGHAGACVWVVDFTRARGGKPMLGQVSWERHK